MPLYDQKCKVCGNTWEDFRSISESDLNPPCTCGGESSKIIVKGSGGSHIFPTEWEHLTPEPNKSLHVANRKELKAILKQKNMISHKYS